MQSLAEFRHHMIDGQLEPNNVLEPRITAAMGIVPREAFVPEEYAQSAYIDDMITLYKQRYMPSPLVIGCLLQALAPEAKQNALVVGSGTGYTAALMHHLGCQTIMLESSQELANRARRILNTQQLSAIEVHTGPLDKGHASLAPYDLILVEGAVDSCPPAWTEQLADGGKLTYLSITSQLPLEHQTRGQIVTVRRDADALIETTGIELACPILPGARMKEGFNFA